VFIEQGVSGKVPALHREQFKRLHDRLRAGDVLIVAKLDRLGRDVVDVVTTVQTLTGAGVAVEVLGLGKLDNSAQSQLTLNMLAAISQFERQIIGSGRRPSSPNSRRRASGWVGP